MAKQVTIYISASLHDDFKRAALEEKTKVSDLVARAMRTFLDADGAQVASSREVADRGAGGHVATPTQFAALTDAVARQTEILVEIRDQMKLIVAGAGSDRPPPLDEPDFAEACRIVVDLLTRAGSQGMAGKILQNRLRERGVSFAAGREVTAALQRDGVIKRKKLGWHLTAAKSEGDD